MSMTSNQLAWLIRRHGIEMTHLSGGSHIGAILSVADIIAVLYADVLKYDPENETYTPLSEVQAAAETGSETQASVSQTVSQTESSSVAN